MDRTEIKMPDRVEVEGTGLKKALVSAMPFFIRMTGLMVRTAGRVPPGDALIRAMGKMNAGLITAIGLFGVKKTAGPVAVAEEWLKMIEGIDARYEVASAGDDEVEIHLLQCPLGLTPEHGRDMCLTAMATDMETVKRLGGKLEIGETIATGADRCHLKVVSP